MNTVGLVAAGATDAASAVGARIGSFARGLSGLGWAVQVIDVGLTGPTRYQDIIERRLPPQARARLDSAGAEGDVMPSVWWQARRRIDEIRPDIALVSVPPFSLLGSALTLASRLPVVIDYRDPWSARHRPHALGRLTRGLERSAAQRASMITFAGHSGLGDILKSTLGLQDDRVVHLPNGVDRTAARRETPRPQAGVDGSPLDLVFVGHWYGRNGPGVLIDALARVGRSTAALTTIGTVSPNIDGVLRAALGDGYRRSRPLTGADLHERIACADAALLTMDYSSPVESRIPTKVYDYMSAGVPILAVCPAESAVLKLADANHFHHIDFRDTDRLAAFLSAAAIDRSLLGRDRIVPVVRSREEQTKVLHDALIRCLS